jgi:hypothetical protein
MSKKGAYYYKLVGMYGDNEQWQPSKDMLEKAIQKGGIIRIGDV